MAKFKAITQWQIHTSDKCPVPETAKVIYKTVYYEHNRMVSSHVHLPVVAGEMNWGHNCGLGRIYQYAVVS